jgi:beta-1,4-mannosyl-glycoprotein beta-1,4-N-acetylglucosaminyltransferase
VIYDCFTFSGELDLLEVRLRLLEGAVDYFVLCEAPFTFRGNPKPLWFAESAGRFSAWRDRIIALVYPGPLDDDPWQNEWKQRDYLATALAGCDPNDLVLLSDCDEIPDPRNVTLRPSSKLVLGHRQRMSTGYVNRVKPEPWIGTRSLPYRNLANYAGLRTLRFLQQEDIDIVDGGWHFSSFGGPEVMRAKMTSYAHSEFDMPYYTDLRRLEVKYASEREGSYVPLDDSFPALFREDSRWSKYVWTSPKFVDPELTVALEHVHGCFAYVPDKATEVAVVAAESMPIWERAGMERFGAAFAGVARCVAALHSRKLGTWIVIDGIERERFGDVQALRNDGCAVVGYARNSRSFRVFEQILEGGCFPAGPAAGMRELHHFIDSAHSVDRIRTDGVYVPWAELPSHELRGAALGRNFRFDSISRDDLDDFLCHAVVLTYKPTAAT